MTSKNDNSNIKLTRRDFIGATAVGILAASLVPGAAFAESSDGITIPPESVDELWAKAVRRAETNNEPVYYNCDEDDSPLALYSINTDTKLEVETSISIRPEHVSATVFYVLSDDKKKIEKYRKIVIYATTSDVISKTVNHTIADGKRTLIISCHIVLKSNYLGVSQAYKLYIECYYNGKGYIKIEHA